MATMKKAAKAKAVAGGTFYECGYCGKEGTNAPFSCKEYNYSCGQKGDPKTARFCSKSCARTYIIEGNATSWCKELDELDQRIENYKGVVKMAVECGEQLPKRIISDLKLFKIKRAMLALLLQGDRKAVQNLYKEKREVISDALEEIYETYGDGDGDDKRIYLEACSAAKWMAEIGWERWDI